jgi:hypothetical protein
MNFDLNSLPREKLSAARKLGGKNSYIYKSFRKKRKGNRAFLGKKHSLTSKHKISLANTGKPAWNKGIPRSQETKDKIRNSLLNRFSLTNPSV